MEESLIKYKLLTTPVRLDRQVWPAGTKPLVSISCIAFNHEKYIRECLESLLSQETTFPVEILIHDDASLDGTPVIIREYEKQYPSLIKAVYQEENKWSKNKKITLEYNIPRAQGDYISFCECDDKWINVEKIQHQFNFLTAHQEFVAHSHNVLFVNLITSMSRPFGICENREMTFEELYGGWPYHSASLMVRSDIISSIPVKDLPHWVSGDKFLNRWIACHGRVYYEGRETMAIYHRHDTGLSATSNYVELACQNKIMLDFLETYVPRSYRKIHIETLVNALRHLALVSAEAGSSYPNRIRVVLKYLLHFNAVKNKRLYFLLLIIFGKTFYKVNEWLHGRSLPFKT